MKDIERIKNRVAVSKGYPNWETYENWIIEHNYPVAVAQLLVGAMTEVCFSLVDHKEKEIVSYGLRHVRSDWPTAKIAVDWELLEITHEINPKNEEVIHTYHFKMPIYKES